MADAEDELASASIDQRHKSERKALQAEIQKLKHSIPKGDKKKKKEVTAQIALLEEELDARHEREIKEQKEQVMTAAADDLVGVVTDKINNMSTNEDTPEKTQKISKAQRRKEKKAEQEREREERIQAQEVENISGARHQEMEKLNAILKKRNLEIFEVPSDGNCLYTAISDQLKRIGFEATPDQLRQQTAEHMLENVDDFLPFLTNNSTGEPYTIEEFSQYCDDVAHSPAWGGQLELRAMSVILQTPIEVVQADVPSIILGQEYDNAPLVVSYHHHIYSLGEHYNSVIVKRDVDEEDGDD